LFLAGHETTANALSWIFYNLGTHPEIQKKAAAEVWNVLKDHNITRNDLSKVILKYNRILTVFSFSLNDFYSIKTISFLFHKFF
jgi:cytochrome P450